MGPRSFNRGNRVGVVRPLVGVVRPFNGAAVIQPRKPRFAEHNGQTAKNRLQWGRGHSTAETSTGRLQAGHDATFNGAAVIQPRKRFEPDRDKAPSASFNGAAVIQPRKQRNVWFQYLFPILQWGRGHSTAETRPPVLRQIADSRSFNGAAVIQPRKLVTVAFDLVGTGPSMGPRSFNRGNEALDLHQSTEKHVLQWGRGHSTAET